MSHLVDQDLNIKQCKEYLKNLVNIENHHSQPNQEGAHEKDLIFHCEAFTADEITSIFSSQSQKQQSHKKLPTFEFSTDTIIRLFAKSIYTIINSKDSIVKLSATQLSFCLMSTEGASATGCCSITIFTLLSNHLTKLLRDLLIHWEDEASGHSAATRNRKKNVINCLFQLIYVFEDCYLLFEYLESVYDYELIMKSFLYLFYIGTMMESNEVYNSSLQEAFCRIFWVKTNAALAVNSCLLPILTWKPDANDGLYPNEKSFKSFYITMVQAFKIFLNHAPLTDLSVSLTFQFNLSFSLLQRMILKCPEKATMKASTCEAVSEILHAMMKKFPRFGVTNMELTVLGEDSENENADNSRLESSDTLDFQSSIIEFVQKLCHSNKPATRSGVLDFIAAILLQKKNSNSEVEVEVGQEKISGSEITTALLTLLIDRCYDSSPITRFRAISNLGKVAEEMVAHRDQYSIIQSNMKKKLNMLLDLSLNAVRTEKPQFRAKALHLYTFLLFLTGSDEDCHDVSHHSVYKILDDPFDGNELEIFSITANDPNSSVRRQTISSLNSLLLHYKGSSKLKHYWINSLLPLVSDPFSSVAEKVASCMNEVIFKNLSGWHVVAKEEQWEEFPSLALELLYLIDEQALKPLFQTVVQKLYVINGTTANNSKLLILEDLLFKSIRICQSAVELTDINYSSKSKISLHDLYGCWILLEAIFPLLKSTAFSVSSAKEITSFLIGSLRQSIDQVHYKQSLKHDQQSIVNRKIMNKLIQLFHQGLSLFSKGQFEEVDEMLTQILISEEALTDLLETLIQSKYEISKLQLLEKKSKKKDANIILSAKLLAWANPLFEKLYKTFQNTIQVEEKLVRSLLILGGLVLIGFRKEESEPNLLRSFSGAELSCTVSAELDFVHFSFPESILQSLIGFIEASCNSDIKQTSLSGSSSIMVSAIAILTLGKFCLRSQQIARNCIPLLLKYLHQSEHQLHPSAITASSSSSSVLRVNLLHVLSDLCIRYTHLIHHHIHEMTVCLHDGCSKVRRTAFLLLSNLLLQDFIKWKGSLLYEFLTLVIDYDQDLGNIAKRMITKTLLLKFPDLLRSNFTTAFFALNHYENPTNYLTAIAATASVAEERAAGKEKTTSHSTAPLSSYSVGRLLTQQQRFVIYHFISNEFSEEIKLDVVAKIVNDILVPAVDNTTQLLKDYNQRYDLSNRVAEKENYEAALEDALLYLKSLSLESHKEKGENFAEESEGLENELTNNPMISEARKKILKTLSKQQLINQILPVVISLKRSLERLKSPIQRYVMEYLTVLFQQNKVEIEQALQFDPILKAEIEYDLKQYERLLQMQKSSGTPRKQAVFQQPSASTSLSLSSASAVVSSMKKPVLKASSSKKTPLQMADTLDIAVESGTRRRSWGVVINDLSTEIAGLDENLSRDEAPAKKSRRSFNPKVSLSNISSSLLPEEPKEKSTEKAIKHVRKERKNSVDSLLSTLL